MIIDRAQECVGDTFSVTVIVISHGYSHFEKLKMFLCESADQNTYICRNAIKIGDILFFSENVCGCGYALLAYHCLYVVNMLIWQFMAVFV